MKLFVAFLCLSSCFIVKGYEERCVRLRDCPPLMKKFKEQGPSILKNYETCGKIQVRSDSLSSWDKVQTICLIIIRFHANNADTSKFR